MIEVRAYEALFGRRLRVEGGVVSSVYRIDEAEKLGPWTANERRI
jgi:hypothetical protein